MRADVAAVDAALSSHRREQRQGPLGRPTLRALWEAVLEYLELDATEFELRPRAAPHVHAKRPMTWLWVREYEGRQDRGGPLAGDHHGIGEGLYATAVKSAGEYDQHGTAIASQLAARPRRRTTAKTRAREQSLPVRYFPRVRSIRAVLRAPEGIPTAPRRGMPEVPDSLKESSEVGGCCIVLS